MSDEKVEDKNIEVEVSLIAFCLLSEFAVDITQNILPKWPKRTIQIRRESFIFILADKNIWGLMRAVKTAHRSY